MIGIDTRVQECMEFTLGGDIQYDASTEDVTML